MYVFLMGHVFLVFKNYGQYIMNELAHVKFNYAKPFQRPQGKKNIKN